MLMTLMLIAHRRALPWRSHLLRHEGLSSLVARYALTSVKLTCSLLPTQFAVSAFNGSLLRELVNTPIRVTQICPGSSQPELPISALSRVHVTHHALSQAWSRPSSPSLVSVATVTLPTRCTLELNPSLPTTLPRTSSGPCRVLRVSTLRMFSSSPRHKLDRLTSTVEVTSRKKRKAEGPDSSSSRSVVNGAAELMV